MNKITPIDKFIFYSICEKLLKILDKKNFSTFGGTCILLKKSIIFNELNSNDLKIIWVIQEHIDTIYGLDEGCGLKYITDFFVLDKFYEFERPVKLMGLYFSNSNN